MTRNCLTHSGTEGCGKLPRFNRTHHDRPSLDDIRFFYHLGYYNFSYFEELLIVLEHDPDIVSFIPAPASPSSESIVIPDETDSILDMPIPHKKKIDSPVDNIILHSSSHSDLSFSGNTESGLLNGHSIFPSSEGKSSVASNPKNNDIYTTNYYTCNYCLGKLGFRANNEVFEGQKTINNEENDTISNDNISNEIITNNANKRTAQYITDYLRQYYRDNHIEPTVEAVADDVCKGYREKYGTGTEDKGDRDRIVSLLEKCIQSFKPELASGHPKYEIRMFVPYIKEVFKKSEYKEILAGTGARKCRPKNVILDLYAGYTLTHLSRNKELTLSTYDGFIKFCAEHNVNMDDNMCLACRLLFEHYGWLEKIDANYVQLSYDIVWGKIVKHEGKAMAYTLTEKFPLYAEFKKAVGQKTIDKVRAKGMASVENWESKGLTA